MPKPGRRPGRSEAESIDEAEHGARIIDAMVVRSELLLILARRCARTRRVSPAQTEHASIDMRHRPTMA